MGGFWKPDGRDSGIEARNSESRNATEQFPLNSATSHGGLTEKDANLVARDRVSLPLDEDWRGTCAEMTIAEFVKNRFVPEHVAIKRTSGRTHYQAILKHVLRPEEVDEVFHPDAARSKAKLKANPAWPYMSNVRLRDAQPDHVQRLISAALEGGYSTQTATHIRNVVSAIFSHAIREQYFTRTNPATHVTLPGMKRKEKHTLTLAQTRKVLEIMQYPEREMTLIALLTSMSVAEICGLQWRHVNLTDSIVDRDGELIPPRSIAVRQQWYRGELCKVMNGRHKDLSIPQILLPVLAQLSRRTRCTGWSDFVLMSSAGTPINQMNVAARRLKSIGRELQMPWLSWQVFRRTHATLVYEYGMQFQHQMGMMVYSNSSQNRDSTKGNAPALRLCDPLPRTPGK